jgi:hypothetical protein
MTACFVDSRLPWWRWPVAQIDDEPSYDVRVFVDINNIALS